MTNYPNSQDNNITLPGVSGVAQEDVAINALRDAVFSIELELGITPSGIYSDVRARLDILESRIGFGIPSGITNDGYIKSPLILWNVPSNVTLTISDGYGVPTESRVNGSLFMRADGYANNDFYIRRDGYWVPIQTEEWVAGGDLSGNHLVQKVIGIRTKPLNVSLESIGAVQDGYHLTWNNSGGYWEAQTGFIAGSDLAIDSPFFGRTGQKVIRFQNRTFAATAPVGTTATNGSSIKWNSVQNQWEPQATPMIFIGSVNANDGYTTRVNISSNKIQQSPMTATASKVGMVNLGTSTAVIGGTSDNYAAILGGNNNTASGQFSLTVNGDTGIASALYASILNGLTNQSTASFATVINGQSNQATATQAIVLDGYSNVATAINALVGAGGNNQANATYSSVLNGISNVIASSGTLSSILGGNGNTVSAQNVLIGAASSANVQSNFSVVGSGTSNTVNPASSFSFIGTGNNINTTGLYATVLNSTVATANGLHSLILNGNTNSVTASYSTIGNGNNNTISGGVAYSTIIDGYSNLITGSGAFIGDGYNHTISGFYSSILNGNNNSISSSNSTILNGSLNTMDSASPNNTVLFGNSNSYISSSRAIVAGNNNTLTNVSNAYILGQFNNVQGNSTKITGDLNVVGVNSNFNRIFGNSNNLGTNTIQCSVFGAGNNLINGTHDSLSFGSNNIIDGYGNNIILGMNNIGNSNFGLIFGQYGKTRLYGQQVHSNARFTPGKIGEVQFSRLVLDGYSTVAGTQFFCQLQDTTQPTPLNPNFQDGYSYDMQVRVLVVNTSPIGPNPVVPARFVIDVLAHQEGGVLVLDNVNQTLITPQSSGTPWTVTIGVTGNQLTISVDLEAGPPYVQPTNTPSNRRAVATIEMREMSRL